jgi:hypothetical protein
MLLFPQFNTLQKPERHFDVRDLKLKIYWTQDVEYERDVTEFKPRTESTLFWVILHVSGSGEGRRAMPG